MCELMLLGVLFVSAFSSAQDQNADAEMFALGERLLAQAKAHHEKKNWVEGIEVAERARTTFLALSEFYSSQNRAADVRKVADVLVQCNQLIRLARDSRKAELLVPATQPGQESPKSEPGVVPKPPEQRLDNPTAGPQKFVPPEVPVQEKTLRSIREVFKADYDRQGPAARQTLAQKLIAEAARTDSDRTAQYVLLREAADVAAQNGEFGTAIVAIGALEKEFAVDALALRLAALAKLPPASNHEVAAQSVSACLVVIDEALKADNYDLASFVLKKADGISRKPVNLTLQARVHARSGDVSEIQKERERVKASEQVLLASQDNPEANLQVGRFLALFKQDWQRALPHLRKASGVVGRVAEAELSNPSGANAAMDVGDGWFALSEKEGSLLSKRNLRERARHWYLRALPGLDGFQRTRVEKRLWEIEEESAIPGSVDLLRLIDPKKDTVAGEWKLEEGALFTPTTGFARLQIPFDAPAEYELQMKCERKSGDVALIIGLTAGGRQFMAVLDGWDKASSGLELIDGKGVAGNETSVHRKVFTDEKTRIIRCIVRADRVKVMVNSESIVDWKPDYRRVTQNPDWAVRDRRMVYIASHETVFRISEIRLSPISGPGQKLR